MAEQRGIREFPLGEARKLIMDPAKENPVICWVDFLTSVSVGWAAFVLTLTAPVGLRYHATHHLFPLMPYHALGKAHRQLVKQLPEDSRYMETVRSSLWAALRQLWGETAA